MRVSLSRRSQDSEGTRDRDASSRPQRRLRLCGFSWDRRIKHTDPRQTRREADYFVLLAHNFVPPTMIFRISPAMARCPRSSPGRRHMKCGRNAISAPKGCVESLRPARVKKRSRQLSHECLLLRLFPLLNASVGCACDPAHLNLNINLYHHRHSKMQ